MNNYTFRDGSDDKNIGILIPRYRARGRMAPNGTRYQTAEYKVKDETDLVEVRSIITKFRDKDTVTPDCLSSRMIDLTRIKDGDGIGTSFGTSFTEAITQGILGLKHGGHERVIDTSGYIRAPFSDCHVREDGKWLWLESGKKKYKYPKPSNLVLIPKDSFNEGEVVGSAYNTTSPIYKLKATVDLMRARSTVGKRYFEKDNVIVSDCYAYEEGKIEYRENDRGAIEVWIGTKAYEYNEKCMYYFPEGTKIKKYQRFCSGVENMGHVASDLAGDLRSMYIIFRDQFYTLQDKDFDNIDPSKKVVTGSVQEELVEMLFISLINVNHDEKDINKITSVDYLGAHGGIMNTGSFYTMLSFAFANKVVSKAFKGDVDLKSDVMTDTVLGLLLTNNLDQV